MDSKVYLRTALSQAPRLLGLADRNPNSPTYGCFDRQYWHYRVVDFPCSRMQEAVLTLALLYKTPNAGYRSEKILGLANGGISFWSGIQNRDGSFNEWYPNEGSYVATAFSLYAVCESIRLLGVKPDDATLNAIAKSAKFISTYGEFQATNQECGAALALLKASAALGEEKYAELSKSKIGALLSKQDKEGWFSEYGGADIGYLSLAIDYLSKYYKESGDGRLLNSLSRAVDFIRYFIHPTGSAGGEYGSRNTEYLIPHGFEILAKKHPPAAAISSSIRKSLSSEGLNIDDRYLAYNLYTYLQAYSDAGKLNPPPLPHSTQFTKYFSSSGLYVHSSKNAYLIYSAKKGSLKVYKKKPAKLLLSDCGYYGALKSGKRIGSSVLDECAKTEAGNSVKTDTSLFYQSYPLPKTSNVLALRAAMKLNMLSPSKKAVKAAFRRMLITKSRRAGVTLTREIVPGDVLVVRDTLRNSGKHPLSKLYMSDKFSVSFIPSSKYFLKEELSAELPMENLSSKLNSGKVVVEKRLDIKAEKLEVSISA
ncbi:MAG: hypothetical protein ABH829_02895 [archaeon]